MLQSPISVKGPRRDGSTWTLGEARCPPCEGCTCLSFTLTCVERPAELRRVIACRRTSSSDSFLTPTFLTVPFPAWLRGVTSLPPLSAASPLAELKHLLTHIRKLPRVHRSE